MLAFLPGVQGLEDVLITIIVSVVGSAWGGAFLFLKKREQDFLMNERKNERRAKEVTEIREMNMREEEHNVRVELIKQLAAREQLELTSDGQLRQKR